MITASHPSSLSPGLAEALDQFRVQLDGLLSSLPASSLEARRCITRELHYEPRPEELQTIIRIAEDDTEGGPRYELPRELLRTRLFVDHELRRMLEMKPLDADALDLSAQTLTQLHGEVARLEADMATLVDFDEVVGKKDREYILQMGSTLSCSCDVLFASSTLAARLAELTRAEMRDDLAAETTTLSDEQRTCFRSLMNPIAAERSSRATIDAMAIHSYIDGLLADWVKLGQPSDDDESFRTIRDLLVERFQAAQVALEFVAERLQKQQDEALQAGLSGFADELRECARGLFSVKLRLAPVLRDPYRDVEQQDSSMLAMLRESAADDVALPNAPRKVSEEELYVGALKDMRTRKTAVEYTSTKDRPSTLARHRRRVRLLGAIAGVLLVASIIINFFVLTQSVKSPQAPPILELSASVQATHVETAGPMMFLNVAGWAELPEDQRQSRVDKMSRAGHENGFQSVVIFNEFGEPAAAWQRGRGPGIVVSPQEPVHP